MSEKPLNFDVCVVGGMGHVGLPLAISLADAGKTVVAYDINQEAVDTVQSGEMPFLEEGAEEVLNRVLGKTFYCSTDNSDIAKSHYIVLVIGTPVDEHLNPNLGLFTDFIDSILDQIHDGQHIILRSTVFPGTTAKTKRYLENLDRKTKLSFCPERIAQGKAMEELRSLPQIVASFDDETAKEAAALFDGLSEEIVYLEPIEAELGKLFNNVWRYITFAISNQFYQIACQNNVDFYKIYQAITHNYPRTKDFPKAGFAAGPCLFKDTMQLASYSKNTFFLGHAAMLINEGLPDFVVHRLVQEYSIKDKVVGILGMAFKANNDDKRESLSYKLKKILGLEAKKVLCSDVYIDEEGFVDGETLIKESDIIILAAPHREYRDLEFPGDKILVDIWNYYGEGGLF